MRSLVLFSLILISPKVLATCDPALLVCRLASRFGVICNRATGGHICVLPANYNGSFYPQKTAVLIPEGTRTPVRMVLGMHGNRGHCPTTGAAPLDIALSWDAVRSLPQGTVMIFPMSQGPTTNYDNDLAPRFGEFSRWAETLTGAPSGVDWILSGHSGAGRAMAKILGQRPANVHSALMLDAAYNVREQGYAEAWRNAREGRARVFNVYSSSAGTQSNSRWLESTLGSGRIVSRHIPNDSHCSVPRLRFGELLREALGSPSSSPASSPPMPVETYPDSQAVPELQILFSPITN